MCMWRKSCTRRAVPTIRRDSSARGSRFPKSRNRHGSRAECRCVNVSTTTKERGAADVAEAPCLAASAHRIAMAVIPSSRRGTARGRRRKRSLALREDSRVVIPFRPATRYAIDRTADVRIYAHVSASDAQHDQGCGIARALLDRHRIARAEFARKSRPDHARCGTRRDRRQRLPSQRLRPDVTRGP